MDMSVQSYRAVGLVKLESHKIDERWSTYIILSFDTIVWATERIVK
jgi:hypothetical protein